MIATTLAPADTEKVQRLRAQLPATATTGYFNAGTNGPLPRIAYETIQRAAETELLRGRIVPGVYEGHAERNDRIRALLARMFGGSPDEFALMRSTNDGLNIAFNGLSWAAGDEIITTSLEHPCMLVPLSLLAHRDGVRLRVADLGDGAGNVAEQIEALVNERTKVIALSHVLWSSGAVVDIQAVCEMAHRYNILVVVDAAQSGGQIAVNLPELGVDAYAVSGQKWLCGPEGTGALYIRKDRFPDFSPSAVRYGTADPSGYFMPPTGARRYEMGESYAPAMHALEAVLTWLIEEVGLDWSYARTEELGKRALDGLAEIDNVSMHSNRSNVAGLICFNVEGWTPQQVTARLYDRGFTIRYVDYPPGPTVARASVGWWNTEGEVDALVAEVAKLAASSGGDDA